MSLVRRGLRAARHPIAQNALALHAVQAANMVVPLLTIPYTSRVLLPAGFGLVIFAQGLSFLLGVLIGWGFDSWATRDAAELRRDRAGLSALVARVTGARMLLSGVALVVALVATLANAKLRENPGFGAMAWLAAVAGGMTPMWFFIGIERMRLVSVAALTFRGLGAALTFVLVKNSGDAWIVMALFTGSAMLTAVFSNVLLLRRIDVVAPRLRSSLAAMRSATALFAGTAALTLYTALNVVLLGFLGTSAQVAHFGAAERIVRSGVQLLYPAGIALFPRVAYLKAAGDAGPALRVLLVGGAIAGAAALGFTAVLVGLAPQIVHVVYGSHFQETVGVLRVIALIIPVSLTSAGAAVWLMASRRDTRIVQALLAGGVVNLALAPVMVHLAGARGMAISVLCAELVVMTAALLAARYARPRGAAAPAQGSAAVERAR